MKHLIILFVGMLTLAGGVSAHLLHQDSSEHSPEKAASTAGLGDIEFPTSTSSEEAQQWFLRGVLLLHNFQYEDAKAAFFQAQVIDPNFAMAYWGEAMAENHPLWLEQDAIEAKKILKRLAPTLEARLAKAPTQREKGYLQAVDLLYGDGDKETRDHSYEEAMYHQSETFPDDHEAAAFYALALLGSEQGQRNHRTSMQAASIAQEIINKNPRHPGAVHYLIHSTDDPIHAPLGLWAARLYGSLAPASSHAKHMPSHVFLALGMWKDVAKANEAAWETSKTHIKQLGLSQAYRDYHALHWLEYAYLQQGRVKDAKDLLDIIEEAFMEFKDTAPQTAYTLNVKNYDATMHATYIIETRQWDVARLNNDRSPLRFSSAAGELFAIGMSGVRTQQAELSRLALAELKDLIGSIEDPSKKNQALAGSVMANELEGLLLLEAGHQNKALQLLQEATEMEDRLPYAYGPSFPIKPAHELLGEVLLELGQKEKAKKEFELALEGAPRRTLALEGLAQSTH